MITISFLAGELLFAGIWLLLRIIIWIRNRRIDWKHEALLLLMFINLAVIIRMIFFPMYRVDGKIQPLVIDIAAISPLRVNLTPFVYLFDYDIRREMLLNIIGNVTVFIPTGIILPILYWKLNSFWKVVGMGALISLAIEIIQLLISTRASDIDDLILNTLGVAIGYGIYALIRGLRNRPRRN